MTKLTLQNSKLRWSFSGSSGGKLILSPRSEDDDAPCCCGTCKYFWFGFCNVNAATDDNMNVTFNGTSLGVMDLNANAAVGWILHTGPAPERDEIPWGTACHDFATFKKISKSDLRVGTNSFETTLAQANNNGNYGIWTAGLWPISKDRPTSCPVLASGSYGSATGTYTWSISEEQYDSLVDE